MRSRCWRLRFRSAGHSALTASWSPAVTRTKGAAGPSLRTAASTNRRPMSPTDRWISSATGSIWPDVFHHTRLSAGQVLFPEIFCDFFKNIRPLTYINIWILRCGASAHICAFLEAGTQDMVYFGPVVTDCNLCIQRFSFLKTPIFRVKSRFFQVFKKIRTESGSMD